MYEFTIYLEGNGWSDGEYETYEDAMEGAYEKISDLLEDWGDDEYTEDDFEIVIR